jgi:crotonobetainyl-CoA:carnitine CoA-transferase CaiB-like acyl-CoA transferase
MNQPLSGLTILDLTHHVAGPFATRLLAAYGADVIKIEPPAGDPARHAQPIRSDKPETTEAGSSLIAHRSSLPSSARFLSLNTGKRSLVLDLKTAEGHARFLDLAQHADAVVENLAPRVLPSLGLDWPVLHAVNPRLVLTSISNFGQSGPYRDWAATNLTLFAAGGQMALTGEPDREPLLNGGTQPLMQAGLHGFAATVTAIFGARAHGAGAHVDISIQEVQAASLEGAGPAALVNGLDAGRGGNLPRAMWGIYPCADGYVGCSCLERNVPNLLAAIGREDLLTDSEFRDPAWRMAHNDEVTALLMGFFLQHTKQELLEIAARHRVPFGYITTVEELLRWPALHEKGFWQTLDHPDTDTLQYPGPPFTVDGGGYCLTPAPLLDEHREAILEGPSPPGPLARPDGRGGASLGHRHSGLPLARSGGRGGAVSEANRVRATHRPLPLHGVRIVDLTMVWAGPYGTRLLADMGADVIKVEGVTNPDLVRGIGLGTPGSGEERPWDRSPYFNEYNRGKRGITLDLTHPEGRQALLALVRTADALIENYRADVLDNLGLSVAVLHAERPDLVIVSMPGFAKHGAEAAMVGYGPNIEQMGGLVELTGYQDGPAQKTGISYGDPVAGIVAAGALVSALLRRQRTGEGAVVEVSQRDNMVGLIGEAVLEYQLSGAPPPRRGNRHAWMAPHGCYPCRPLPENEARPLARLGAAPGTAIDRWITIAVATDQQWRALCEVIGRPDLAADPRYATVAARHANQDDLDAILSAWTAARSDDEAAAALQARGVPAFAVRTPLTVTRDPHLAARGFYHEVVHPIAGSHRVAGPLWNLSEPAVALRSAAPSFGQHNDEIFTELLGLPHQSVERWYQAGVTGDTPQTDGRARVPAR